MANHKISEERLRSILAAAITVAEVHGYNHVTRDQIAAASGVSSGTLTTHWGSIAQVRRAIMGEAIRVRNLTIIAQGLSMKDKRAMNCSEDLKRAALDSCL